MKIFTVVSQGSGRGVGGTAIVVANDIVQAIEATVTPVALLVSAQASTMDITLDARAGGTGNTAAFYWAGVDYKLDHIAFTGISKAQGSVSSWDNLTTWQLGRVVSYLGSFYLSLTAGNIGSQPDISPLNWSLITTPLVDPVAVEFGQLRALAQAGTPPDWDATTSYAPNIWIGHSGLLWQSNNSNYNSEPMVGNADWTDKNSLAVCTEFRILYGCTGDLV